MLFSIKMYKFGVFWGKLHWKYTNDYLRMNYLKKYISSLQHQLKESLGAARTETIYSLTDTNCVHMGSCSQRLHFDLFRALSPHSNPLGLDRRLLVCERFLLSKSRSLESLLARIRLTCVLGCHLESRPVKPRYVWFARCRYV